MDNHQRDSVRLWSLPGGIAASVFLGVFWLPFYDAIVHGQITPILTGILALGMGRSPFARGLCVGLAAALKPPFALLIPFVGVSFGKKAFLGCLITASLALIHPGLFIEYVRLLPELSGRVYGDIGLVRLLGVKASLFIAVIASLWISLRWRDTEESYMGIIAVTALCTALWFHAYTPLVLPVVYFISNWIGTRLSSASGS